jgi:hypothetical protein
MNVADIISAITPVVDAFDRLSVDYSVVGSVASSAHGIARATLDADLVADLALHHVEPLVNVLVDGYYIDRDAAEEAVRRRSMFNVVHLETMVKVDIYVLTGRSFDRESFGRRTLAPLESGEAAREYSVDTPEDTILHKLEWYRAGGGVSDRQWSDIVGVLKIQSDALDSTYMRRWAASLGVEDLLNRALADSGAIWPG